MQSSSSSTYTSLPTVLKLFSVLKAKESFSLAFGLTTFFSELKEGWRQRGTGVWKSIPCRNHTSHLSTIYIASATGWMLECFLPSHNTLVQRKIFIIQNLGGWKAGWKGWIFSLSEFTLYRSYQHAELKPGGNTERSSVSTTSFQVLEKVKCLIKWSGRTAGISVIALPVDHRHLGKYWLQERHWQKVQRNAMS